MTKNTKKMLAVALTGLLAGMSVHNAYAGDEVAPAAGSDSHKEAKKDGCNAKKDSCNAKKDSCKSKSGDTTEKKVEKNSCKGKEGCNGNSNK